VLEPHAICKRLQSIGCTDQMIRTKQHVGGIIKNESRVTSRT